MGLTRAYVERNGEFFPAEMRADKLVVVRGDGLSENEAIKRLKHIRLPEDNDLKWTGRAEVPDSQGILHQSIFLDEGEPKLVVFDLRTAPKRGFLARLGLKRSS